MRENYPLSFKGNILHVGLFGQAGMLHRTKYSRFRNDSVTSLEEGSHAAALAVSAKAPSLPSPCPTSIATSPADQTCLGSPDDGSTTLCTFIPKMANIKLSNPATLLGLKGSTLPSSKDVPRTKLSGSSRAALGSLVDPEIRLTSYLSAPSYLQEDVTLDKLTSMGTSSPSVGLREMRTEALTLNKTAGGTECSGQEILETGMTYYTKYIGCLEVLQSMRMLDFGTRTQVTREAISRLCDAVPCAKGPAKRRKPPSKGLSAVLGKSNLQFSGMNVKLTISTNSLSLTTVDSQQIIAQHHMQSISFASGGDPDTTDYVAYVAKDPVNQRACHILECPDGLAQEVINTIGQAFELRFRQFLNNPSSLIATKQSSGRAVEADCSAWAVEGTESHEYYNEIPGKEPPPGGILDMRLRVESVFKPPGSGQPEDEQRRWNGSPQHPNVYENCSLTQKQLFPTVESTEVVYSSLAESGSLSSVLHHIQELLQNEAWYHGKMSRREAERLLTDNGDFLVRESTTTPGQYVLSGLQGDTAKHLLLVDPEGMVRTKDHIFNSVGHLIRYHMDNQRPIISSGSELCLKQPVVQKQ
ncbi:SHC-transforming protein 4-like [Amia ocellicauda]|uniref:SHC-transforming protein 4-like n=1 Tax=Amia ocellicauda TaxID=2972642 RepID=UPI0034643F8E